MDNKVTYGYYLEPSESTPMIRRRNSRCKCLKWVPARYALAILGFLGFINVYAMRVNISVAMVAMVNQSAIASQDGSTMTACAELLPPYTNSNETETDKNVKSDGEFLWDVNTQAKILGSFFYGYVITQIPGGLVAQHFGAKWLFGCGILVTSIFTLLTPLAAQYGPMHVVSARVVEGLGEGVTFPAVNAMIGRWVPKMERSRISTLIFTGSPVGTVVAMALSGILSGSNLLGGWPSVFYVFGSLGLAWFVFWIFLITDKPEDHPRISDEELRYIKENVENAEKPKTPWKEIFTSVPLWVLAITHFGQNWGFYTLLTEMPTYLSTILHFDIKQNGLLSSLPYVLQAICAWIASCIADKMRESGKFRISTIRKIMNSIAFYGPGACILIVAFVGCRPVVIMVLLCLAMGFNGFMYSGFNVTHVDMSPDFCGTLMGITNCISNFSGFLAPLTVGSITSGGQTIHNWGLVFAIASAVYFFTGTLYNIFCSAELQPWGRAQKNEEPEKDSTLSEKKQPPIIVTVSEKK